MKTLFPGIFFTLILLVVLFVLLHHVGKSPRHEATAPTRLYNEKLKSTAKTAANPEPGSGEVEAMIDRVRNAFSPFTVANVKENFPEAYAEDTYFRDAFHTYTNRSEMVAYMVKSAEMSGGEVYFEFSEPARNGVDFYLPWTMVLPGKDEGESQRSIGVSRLRFNPGGKVIFHQDYWDSADVLVPKVPVANGLIELVRRRF